MDLNLSLSWKRVKKDFVKNFIYPLFLPEILETDLNNWLADLKNKFDSNEYHPHTMEVVEIPKGNGLVRPGSLLVLEDSIYYSCLVHECYRAITQAIKWSQNNKDFAYIVNEDSVELSEWFKNSYEGWKNFRDRSLEEFKEGYQYVVMTDITGFYENIDIQLIISDLSELQVEQEVVTQISRCLNRWSKVGNKGIPQGYSASDLLAKLYMDAIDKGMQNQGFVHLRYVDDIRIFCKSMDEAKRALIELTRLLRKRGLNLQSAKTYILKAKEAENEIEGVQSIINVIAGKILEDALTAFEIAIDYYSEESEETEFFSDGDEPNEPEDLRLSDNKMDDSNRILRETFNSHFLSNSDDNFNKTLFHYLLNRFKEESDGYALEYVLSILDKHPEETKSILQYLEIFNEFDEIVFDTLTTIHKKLISFISSTSFVYDYQIYLILRWLSKKDFYDKENLLQACRTLAFDNNKPYYLKCIARKLLGVLGNSADLDRLVDLLDNQASEFERAEILCCLVKLGHSKKNSLIGRFSKDGALLKMAGQHLKKVS